MFNVRNDNSNVKDIMDKYGYQANELLSSSQIKMFISKKEKIFMMSSSYIKTTKIKSWSFFVNSKKVKSTSFCRNLSIFGWGGRVRCVL